jgi:hypothetical protein
MSIRRLENPTASVTLSLAAPAAADGGACLVTEDEPYMCKPLGSGSLKEVAAGA